jgi:hypothetical protein
VLAEVSRVDVCGVARFFRQQHLTAVTDRRDSCSFVHVVPDVALLREVRDAGVHAYAHVDRTGQQSLLRFASAIHGSESCREGDEERVTLSVDFYAAVTGERIPQDQPVL